MTNFIPVFPLSLVVYPGEKLNLHIFEPRYKQLILDCLEKQKPFGIPAVINNKLKELGCLVEVTEVSKTYDDGKMDIKTQGLKIFKTLELVRDLPDKLYGGAIVTYLDNYDNGSMKMMKKLLSDTRNLHQHIGATKDFGKDDSLICSYDLAHHVGLSQDEEYELMGYENELHRQEFLKRHLQKITSVLKEMDTLKKKIQLNGHFKNLGGFGI